MTSSILLYSIICKYIHLRKTDKSRLICSNWVRIGRILVKFSHTVTCLQGIDYDLFTDATTLNNGY